MLALEALKAKREALRSAWKTMPDNTIGKSMMEDSLSALDDEIRAEGGD